ncbi:alpha-hydroxy acid oxidase [Flexivirga caeni]|uniref:Alpha-hydroxy-acid oxidizing protein n=1 Tax=Flexivirga caeni TaxID=2294115 RepID=A0A3M9MKS1_9MICO|nr:alpha-hydroxy acid oxidase [Flexivirga caeni]RNI25483.1 alpha-hydroxy-acid oxidizing protein [Flexivirga caeni]
MKPQEIGALVKLRKPQPRPTQRVLERSRTIEDLRRAAHRRWPPGVRDYVEGGADGEVSLQRNRDAYERHSFLPRTLQDVSDVDTTANLLGMRSALPIALGPTGYTRMMHERGESAVARAAAPLGIPYTLSTMATTSVEDVRAVSAGNLWFQLYVWRDRGLMRDLIARAAASDYQVLMLTVDTPVTGLRLRDSRTGFTIPPQLSPSTILGMAAHPAWCARMLAAKQITFANIPGHQADPAGVMEFAAAQFDPTVSWDDLAEIRELWRRPMIVKGLAQPDDVRRAVDLGVDAIALSNHGGRQLDQSVPPIDLVSEIREIVSDSVDILVDSGIRRGSDVAIAVARGATGCLVGRPYLYGLGAAGEAGVRAAIGILGDELRRAMQLLGVPSLAALAADGRTLVHPASAR